jgi:hypothetical protein
MKAQHACSRKAGRKKFAARWFDEHPRFALFKVERRPIKIVNKFPNVCDSQKRVKLKERGRIRKWVQKSIYGFC